MSFRWRQKGLQLKKAINDLKQSLRARFDKFSTVVVYYGLRLSSSDHSIFVQYFSAGIIILVIYVNDIVITRDDHQDIIQLKAYLSSHFHMKDHGLLRYILVIEVASFPKNFFCVKENILVICWKKLVH